MNTFSILLVEDDPDDVELMVQALKDNAVPYVMETISQGDKVIPHLESCQTLPDIIILDLNLPKLHGREILTRLKASAQFETTPVVILTTASSQQEKDQCARLGADLFITKPSTVKGFDEMVAAIVNTANVSRRVRRQAP
jgi:DNA-binding response OmpR family regulator